MPALAIVAALAVGHARGPNWLGFNADPAYVYLLNGLNILEGDYPRHTDHPGTPLQLLAAAVAGLAYSANGAGGTVRRFVLGRPELLLTLLNWSLVLAFGLATLAVGRAAYRLSSSLACAVCVQLAPLLSPASVTALGSATPEPALLALGVALAAVALDDLHPTSSPGPRSGVAAIGVLAGVGVATKVTFLPAALAGLLILQGGRRRAVAGAVAVAAFAGAVLPALPMAGRTLVWFEALLLHSDRYGRGPATVIDVGSYPIGLFSLVEAEPVFFILLAASAVALLLIGRALDGRPAPAPVGRWRTALAIVMAAELIHVLVVAKDPQPRYLMPVIGLSGLGVGLASTAGLAVAGRRGVVVSVLLIVFTVGVGYQARSTAELIRGFERTKGEQLGVYTLAQHLPAAQLAVFYGSTSPAYALHYGNEVAGRRYTPDLRELFPQAVFYALRTGEFWRFGGEPVPGEEVRGWLREDRLFLQGPRVLLPRRLRYEVVADTEVEGLFRVRVP